MRKTPTPPAGHPDERKLVLRLAGELSLREARPIGIHLRTCRKCRAKLRTLEAGFDAFAEYRQAAFVPAAGRPPNGWSGFSALLDSVSTAGKRAGRSKAS